MYINETESKVGRKVQKRWVEESDLWINQLHLPSSPLSLYLSLSLVHFRRTFLFILNGIDPPRRVLLALSQRLFVNTAQCKLSSDSVL
jgi:hypothetical protein